MKALICLCVLAISSTHSYAESRVKELVSPKQAPLTENYLFSESIAQLWSSLRAKAAGEDLRFFEQHALIDQLNALPDRQASSQMFSQIFLAYEQPDAQEKLFKARSKFSLGVLIESDPLLILSDTDALAYVLGFGSLRYADHLPKQPIAFGSWSPNSLDPQSELPLVEAFGIDYQHNEQFALASLVKVLEYHHADDFIVVIDQADGRQVLLAKFEPKADFQKTLAYVSQRRTLLKGSSVSLSKGDLLLIPKLSWHVLKNYEQLCNNSLQNPGLDSWFFSKFVLELGLELGPDEVEKSPQTVPVLSENIHLKGMPLSDRKLIFDKPFLVACYEDTDKQPYLAAWVQNIQS